MKKQGLYPIREGKVWGVNIRMMLVVIGIAILLQGCQATSAALGKKIPEEYIEVVSDEPVAEVAKALEASGQDYVCKEMYYGRGSSLNRKACFVKAPEDKSLYEKVGVKLQDVPEALLRDTGKNAVIVGYIAIESLFNFPYVFLK